MLDFWKILLLVVCVERRDRDVRYLVRLFFMRNAPQLKVFCLAERGGASLRDILSITKGQRRQIRWQCRKPFMWKSP